MAQTPITVVEIPIGVQYNPLSYGAGQAVPIMLVTGVYPSAEAAAAGGKPTMTHNYPFPYVPGSAIDTATQALITALSKELAAQLEPGSEG